MMKRRKVVFQSAYITQKKFAPEHSQKDLKHKATEIICDLTNSSIGFFHQVEPNQKTISVLAWSSNSSQSLFGGYGKDFQYFLEEAGEWANCIHERRTITHHNIHDNKKQVLSTGQDIVFRELIKPVLRGSINEVNEILTRLGEPPRYARERELPHG